MLQVVSPRTKSKSAKVAVVKVSPSTEKAIREGVEAIRRGEAHTLSREELDRWAETGEFPRSWDVAPTSRA